MTITTEKMFGRAQEITLSTSAMAELARPSAIARVSQKRTGRHRAHSGAKAFFNQGIRGKKVSTKISWQQQQHYEDAPEQISENELQKSEVAAICNRWRAYDRKRGSFGAPQ